MFGLFRKTRKIAVVEWGDGELRLVIPSRGMATAITFPLTAPTEEQAFEVSQRLQDLMRRGMLSAPLCVVLPSTACTFKLLRVSVASGENREQAWRNEAANQLGLPLTTDIELAFAEQPDGVFSAACRRGFLHTYLAPFTQLNLPIRWIVPSIVGLWAAVSEVPAQSWALLEIKGSRQRTISAALAIGKGDSLRLVHTVLLNGGSVEWLAEEVQRALALSHRTFGEPVTRLLIAGERRWSVDEEQIFAQRVLLPMEDFALPAEGRTTEERMLSAIADAIIRNPSLLGFTPPQPETALVWHRIEERLIGAMVVLVILGFIAAFRLSTRVQMFHTSVQGERNIVAQQQRTLDRMSPVSYGARMQGFEKLWQRVGDKRNDPLEVLYLVSKALPTSVWVTEFAFLRDGQVVLRGSGLSHSAVTDAARALSEIRLARDIPLFTEVLTNYANTRTEGDRTFVDFQFTGWLRERTGQRQRQVQRR